MKKHLIIIISVAISVLILGILGLQFMKIQTDKDYKNQQIAISEQKLKDEKAKEFLRQSLLDNCLQAADENYSGNWDNMCVNQGKQADCQLWKAVSDPINKLWQTDKENCFKQYK